MGIRIHVNSTLHKVPATDPFGTWEPRARFSCMGVKRLARKTMPQITLNLIVKLSYFRNLFIPCRLNELSTTTSNHRNKRCRRLSDSNNPYETT